MKCAKCGKNFDEVTYNRICPKCGTFNRDTEEYDVNKYYNFDEEHQSTLNDEFSFSTETEASKEHERLHRMYEHKSSTDAHKKTRQYSQKTLFDVPEPEKKQNKKRTAVISTIAVIGVIIIASVIVTIVQTSLAESAVHKLDYTTSQKEIGDTFFIEDREITVDSVSVLDTSVIVGLPEDEKLVAVHVNVGYDDYDWDYVSEAPYMKVGDVCKENIDSYAMESVLPTIGLADEEIFSEYSYLSSEKSGYFLFFVNRDASHGELVFDVKTERSNVNVLTEKIRIPVSF